MILSAWKSRACSFTARLSVDAVGSEITVLPDGFNPSYSPSHTQEEHKNVVVIIEGQLLSFLRAITSTDQEWNDVGVRVKRTDDQYKLRDFFAFSIYPVQSLGNFFPSITSPVISVPTYGAGYEALGQLECVAE